MFKFKIHEEYFREDVLEFVGSGQQQSGIIWGPKEPRCVIVTSGGSYGKKSGYEDKREKDGTWIYIGQGSKGDQNPHNYANGLLTSQQRNVLLFSTRDSTSKEIRERGSRKNRYKFEGIFDVLSWEMRNVDIPLQMGPPNGAMYPTKFGA
ncbi:hypothetical protein H7F33_10275 [Pedobacter sp. PAMC26386]|nr:hypothetical protein H7F33_10275 [Pedobacter sp. PAMC26386]